MSDTIKILFLGDIVGEPGRTAAAKYVKQSLAEGRVDFVIANGENAAGGKGVSGRLAIDLLRSGIAVVTTGDHAWDQKDTASFIDTEPRLLRPLNYPKGVPGHGSIILETSKCKVAVMNIQGRTFMKQLMENPFHAAINEVNRLREETPVIFVDFHAETTSEKIAMGRFLDGSVSAVIGTHTHVQTADERILPQGTAFLCDVGMCGPHESVLGREPSNVIRKFLDNMPGPLPIAHGPVRVDGVTVEVNIATGLAKGIERVSEIVK